MAWRLMASEMAWRRSAFFSRSSVTLMIQVVDGQLGTEEDLFAGVGGVAVVGRCRYSASVALIWPDGICGEVEVAGLELEEGGLRIFEDLEVDAVDVRLGAVVVGERLPPGWTGRAAHGVGHHERAVADGLGGEGGRDPSRPRPSGPGRGSGGRPRTRSRRTDSVSVTSRVLSSMALTPGQSRWRCRPASRRSP